MIRMFGSAVYYDVIFDDHPVRPEYLDQVLNVFLRGVLGTDQSDDSVAATEATLTLMQAWVDALPDPLVLLEAVRDQDGQVVDFVYRAANQPSSEELGLSQQQLHGRSVIETLPDFEASGLLARCADCLDSGQRLTLDEFAYNSFGRPRLFDVRAAKAGPDLLTLTWRDCTDRYEAAREMLESEEQYRLLAENSVDVMAYVRDGVVVWVSPSVEAAFGAPPSHWVGQTATDLVAVADQASTAAALNALGETGRAGSRLRVVTADGTAHWIEFHAKTYLNKQGNPDGSVSVFRIVDDEVATEEALRRSEEHYRLLAENSVDVVAHVGSDGVIKWVSPSVEAAFGAPPSYWIGRSPLDLVAPTDSDEATLYQKRLMISGIQMTRARAVAVDGTQHWIESNAKPFFDADGEQDGYIAFLRVIDHQVTLEQERDRAIAEQAESDARFRRLMETSNVAMAMMTPDGRFDVVNQALCDMLGYDEEILRTKTWQELTPAAFLQADLDAVERIKAGRLQKYRVTKQQAHADGHLIWVDASIFCLRDSGGDVEYLVAQGVDVTDRVKAIEDNRALAEQLRAELASATGYVGATLPNGLDGPVQVDSRYIPAESLGGDSFDYRWLDDDHLMFYLLDVSGHGVESALLSMSVHNTLRSGLIPVETLLEPEEVLTELDRLFRMEMHDGKYFTLWYGVYTASARTLSYASAGHPPALMLAHRSAEITTTDLSTKSVPIGIIDGAEFTSETYQVPRDAQLLLYSDGAYEIKDTDGRRRSLNEFTDLCTDLATQGALTLDTLTGHLRTLTADGQFADDCSLVLLRFA